MKCPGCDLDLDEDDLIAQAYHMATKHPEIVEEPGRVGPLGRLGGLMTPAEAIAERKRLGRCPSCAERRHRCSGGGCSCPRPACTDVQRFVVPGSGSLGCHLEVTATYGRPDGPGQDAGPAGDVVRCTDGDAVWCPNHGDCRCPQRCACGEPVFEGQETDGQSWWPMWRHVDPDITDHWPRDVVRTDLNDPGCPLHSPTSTHAADPS